MMNIYEQQQKLQDFSQPQLMQEMQQPSGAVPPFLVLTELQRRQRMQAEAAAPSMPTTTVAQDAIAAAGVPQQGLRGMAGALAPKTDMAQNTGVRPVVKQAVGGLAGISRDVNDFRATEEGGSSDVDAAYREALAQRETRRPIRFLGELFTVGADRVYRNADGLTLEEIKAEYDGGLPAPGGAPSRAPAPAAEDGSMYYSAPQETGGRGTTNFPIIDLGPAIPPAPSMDTPPMEGVNDWNLPNAGVDFSPYENVMFGDIPLGFPRDTPEMGSPADGFAGTGISAAARDPDPRAASARNNVDLEYEAALAQRETRRPVRFLGDTFRIGSDRTYRNANGMTLEEVKAAYDSGDAPAVGGSPSRAPAPAAEDASMFYSAPSYDQGSGSGVSPTALMEPDRLEPAPDRARGLQGLRTPDMGADLIMPSTDAGVGGRDAPSRPSDQAYGGPNPGTPGPGYATGRENEAALRAMQRAPNPGTPGRDGFPSSRENEAFIRGMQRTSQDQDPRGLVDLVADSEENPDQERSFQGKSIIPQRGARVPGLMFPISGIGTYTQPTYDPLPDAADPDQLVYDPGRTWREWLDTPVNDLMGTETPKEEDGSVTGIMDRATDWWNRTDWWNDGTGEETPPEETPVVTNPEAPPRPPGGGGGGGGGGGSAATAPAAQMSNSDLVLQQDRWLALARFGAALAASDAPTFGRALGQAGMVGMDSLRQARLDYEQRKKDAEEATLARAALAARGSGGGSSRGSTLTANQRLDGLNSAIEGLTMMLEGMPEGTEAYQRTVEQLGALQQQLFASLVPSTTGLNTVPSAIPLENAASTP